MDVENLAGIDESEAKKNGISIVGYMVAFTMGECAIPNEIVSKYWEDNGLDEHFIPRPSKPKGAFKKACQAMRGHREEEGTTGTYSYYSVFDTTPLTDTQYMITRKIIKVSQDKEETELEHINLMKLKYDKEGQTIFYDLEDSRMGKVAEELFENVFKQKYEIFLTHMTRENIHDAFKRYLKARNAVSLTIGKGGAWFIPAGHEAELEQVKRFYNEIANEYVTGAYGVRIRTIPMIDTLDVNEMVEDGVRNKVEIEMRKIVEETINKLETAEETEENEIIEKALQLTEKKVRDVVAFKERYEKLLKKRITVNIQVPDGVPQSDRIRAIAESVGA